MKLHIVPLLEHVILASRADARVTNDLPDIGNSRLQALCLLQHRDKKRARCAKDRHVESVVALLLAPDDRLLCLIPHGFEKDRLRQDMVDGPECDPGIVADEGDVEAGIHGSRFHWGSAILDEGAGPLPYEVGCGLDTSSAEVGTVSRGMVVAGLVRLGGKEPSQAG